MNKQTKYFLISILFIGIVLSVSIPSTSAQQTAPYGPFPDNLIIFYQGGDSTVIPKIESGEMDAYLYWLSTANAIAAEQNPKIRLTKSYGLYNQFVVNPLETTLDFNPFSLREVREALNWLIDRNYMTNEIWKGRANSKWTMYKSIGPDYARVADYMKTVENEYSYDFNRAKTQIFNTLEGAGATISSGKWYYNGTLIKTRLLIRIEDERRPSGDYLASQLEMLGFTVERIYKNSRDAYSYWGAMAPTKRGDWHIYTMGWISTAMAAYEDDLVWFLYSEDDMPLFGEYQPSPLLREAMDKLNNGEYKTASERNELVKTCTKLSLEDGVFINFNDQLVSFPSGSNLKPYVYDLYGGDQNFWALRTLSRQQAGGTIKLGARNLFMEGFNPACGFSWLYDVYAFYLVSDPGIMLHPHTGRYIPVRSNINVQTAGPTGNLSVPSDAWVYNDVLDKFQPVGSGVRATSKVTYTFNYGQWHDGTNINKADVLYAIAETFKMVTPGSDVYDAIAASAGRVIFTSKLKGIKFTADNIAEVYIDYWHIDDTYIANNGISSVYGSGIWPDTPWELWALMNKVVSEKKAAWSVDQADILGVPMLDLTKGDSIALLSTAYNELNATGYIPPELTELVTTTEATARWKALGDWFKTKNHFWVSNGIYSFDKADPDALQLSFKAFRNYPFRADSWDSMLTVKIPQVAVSGVPTSVVPGIKASFNLTVTVAGAVYNNVDMKYLLMDQQGDVAGSGIATGLGSGKFTVNLASTDTAGLSVGSYKMLVITVGQEASLPVTKEILFTVTPEIAYFQTQIAQIQASLSSRIGSLETRVDTLSSNIQTLTTSLTDARNTINIMIGVSAVSIIVAIAAVFLSTRKK